MGERDTVGQELGYDGLCNYAQRITSCFGLDGKIGGQTDEEEEKEEGVGGCFFFLCGAECKAMKMCGVSSDADFLCVLSECVLI